MLKKRTHQGAFREAAMDEEMSDFDSDDEMNEKDGFNSHCGLRTISEKVLQVLLEKRTTTYKQVSDFITNSEAERLNLLDTPANGFGGMPAPPNGMKVDH